MSVFVAGLPTSIVSRSNKNSTATVDNNNKNNNSTNTDSNDGGDKGGSPYVKVLNQCSHDIVAGTNENGQEYGKSANVPSGGSHTFTYDAEWRGRIWGRYTSDSADTFKFSGIWAPSTLAEFDFLPTRETYYDISLVDGSNLPMSIAPDQISSNSFKVKKHCGTPVCNSLPTCPTEFQTTDPNGKVNGCKSACSHYGTAEYCCTGKYNSPEACSSNKYAASVKSACPDAYSYAYDDATSVYSCGSKGYTVTFCP
ncbi:thaumatin [Cunninghamella echinulata]|nr:thaumatin [Cunninghamella echinulata]